MNVNEVKGALQNYEVYWENEGSERLLGTASVDLPEFEFMTSDLKGAGILGEFSMPVVGHFSSQSMTLHWRTLHEDVTMLTAPIAHHLTLRGAIQNLDAGRGVMRVSPIKINVVGLPKKSALGKLEPGEQTESENEIEVLYLKMTADNEEILEFDKLNHVFKVNGVDYTEDMRSALGRS